MVSPAPRGSPVSGPNSPSGDPASVANVLSQALQQVSKAIRDPVNHKTSRQFAKYLVSVATHPVGLRASAQPLNCSTQDQVAYIADMFNITKSNDFEKLVSTTKRHHWRPELRIRLVPPQSFPMGADRTKDGKEQLEKQDKHHRSIQDMSVRIYLFRTPEGSSSTTPIQLAATKQGVSVPAVANENTSTSSATTTSTTTTKDSTKREQLMALFKRPEPAALIRPIREMRHLVKFDTSGRMVAGDVHLPIRRHHCDQQHAHIVRLEFWLTRESSGNLVNRLDKCLRRLVYDGCRRGDSSRTGNETEDEPVDSTYANDQHKFYGYINLNLTELPAYPSRLMVPISALGRRINFRMPSCELYLDLRNRRLDEEILIGASPRSPAKTTKQQQATSSNPPNKWTFLLNHIRLYAQSMLYQWDDLTEQSRCQVRENPRLFETSCTIDNLLYLPAHSLLNQHRLQSNLSRLDEQSLRRIALILLLVELERPEGATSSSAARLAQYRAGLSLLLVSVLINEFQVARRPLDEKTWQELDPFRDNRMKLSEPVGAATQSQSPGSNATPNSNKPTSNDSAQNSVRSTTELAVKNKLLFGLEMQAIGTLVDQFLGPRLEKHLFAIPSGSCQRTTTLAALRLAKIAFKYMRGCPRAHRALPDLQLTLSRLETHLSNLLGSLVADYSIIQLQAYIVARPIFDRQTLLAETLRRLSEVENVLRLCWSSEALESLTGRVDHVRQRLVFLRPHLKRQLEQQLSLGSTTGRTMKRSRARAKSR